MAKIHMILQGKGGVGKSMIAATLAQYKLAQGAQPLCIDTDPVNKTFLGYKALEVRSLELMKDDKIYSRNFDTLIDWVSSSKDDVIIDNGASSFVPLSHYMLKNDSPTFITEMGHEFIIHTVITGGQALADTVSGFAQLAGQFPKDTMFVIWLNPFWGDIERDGKSFEQMKAYTDNKARIAAIVNIPRLDEDTFAKDFSDMLQNKLTYKEAIAMDTLTIMNRQRLKIIQRDLFGLIDGAKVI